MSAVANDIKLEVCVDSIASALAAADGGAARIELCAALSEGGLTPSPGTLKVLKSLSSAMPPIFCMLRPRPGNDFVYTQLELDALLEDMELLIGAGADGFVFGALTQTRQVDVSACQRVMSKATAAGLPVTFHRAFDVTDPKCMHDTIDCIKNLGFRRLLSSGFRQTAEQGIEALAQLVAKHHKDIIIMPGAGITLSNLEDVLTVTKCVEFHASAKSTAGESARGDNGDNSSAPNSKMECEVSMGREDVEPYSITDVQVVQQMVAMARAVAGK